MRVWLARLTKDNEDSYRSFSLNHYTVRTICALRCKNTYHVVDSEAHAMRQHVFTFPQIQLTVWLIIFHRGTPKRQKPTLLHKVTISYAYLSLPVSLSHSCCSCLPGPTELTVSRFWQMVWDYQVPTVVMLTHCVEGGKVCLKPLFHTFNTWILWGYYAQPSNPFQHLLALRNLCTCA